MGDKPGKYWDHRECAWVKCPTPEDDVVLRAPEDSVPVQQQPAESADADDPTVVGTAQ